MKMFVWKHLWEYLWEALMGIFEGNPMGIFVRKLMGIFIGKTYGIIHGHAQILFDAFLTKYSHRLGKLAAQVQCHAKDQIKRYFARRIEFGMTVSGRCEHSNYFERSDSLSTSVNVSGRCESGPRAFPVNYKLTELCEWKTIMNMRENRLSYRLSRKVFFKEN